MTDEQLMAFIEAEWPDISDKWGCIRWLTGKRHPNKSLDQLCCFWMRHEHD